MSYDENIYARIIDGTISDAEKAKLQETGEWDEINAIIQEVDRLSLPDYDNEGQFSKVQSKIKSKTKSEGKVVSFVKYYRQIAAVLVLGVAAYFLIDSDSNTITSGIGEKIAHNFEDGSNVSLNASSSIAYQSKEWQKNRSVKLTGEGLFSVEPGSTFEVETALGNITVLGTVFNIRAWDGYLSVTCYEGKVQVQNESGSQIIAKGEKVNISPNEGLVKSTHNDLEPYWRNGSSRFKNEPFENVIYELERQFDVSVTSSKMKEPFNGIFDHNDVKKALEQICTPMGLSFKFVTNKKIEIY